MRGQEQEVTPVLKGDLQCYLVKGDAALQHLKTIEQRLLAGEDLCAREGRRKSFRAIDFGCSPSFSSPSGIDLAPRSRLRQKGPARMDEENDNTGLALTIHQDAGAYGCHIV